MSEQPLLSYFQLIFSFSLPKITKFLSLIPKISVILALEHISFLLFLFCRDLNYTRDLMCVPIFCKKFSVGREFSLTNAKYYTTFKKSA